MSDDIEVNVYVDTRVTLEQIVQVMKEGLAEWNPEEDE
jgi:copper chaperone CopZ